MARSVSVGAMRLKVSSNSDSDAEPGGAWKTILVGAGIVIGARLLTIILAEKHLRYLMARNKREVSEMGIQMLLNIHKDLRGSYWNDLMAEYVKKRDTADAYMKKHKFAAKLVELFPPAM